MKAFKTIDSYIQSFPIEVQKQLQLLRKTIKQAAPKAQETMSYKMPTFILHGRYLVYFAAWKHHIALYPGTSKMNNTIGGIEKYKSSKGTFQFSLDEPLPKTFIQQVVRARAKENVAQAKHKQTKK